MKTEYKKRTRSEIPAQKLGISLAFSFSLFAEEIKKLRYHIIDLGMSLNSEDVFTVFGSFDNPVSKL